MINKQLKLLLIFLVSAGVIAISSGLIIMVFNGFNSKNSSQKYETTFFLKNAENQYALFNEDGERLTDFIYTSHSDFINGTAEVTLNDEVGIINSKGKMTVDFGTYESITSKNGVYEARDKNSKSYIINGKGKVLYNLEDAVLHTYINSDYYSVLEDRKAKKYYDHLKGSDSSPFEIRFTLPLTYNFVGTVTLMQISLPPSRRSSNIRTAYSPINSIYSLIVVRGGVIYFAVGISLNPIILISSGIFSPNSLAAL